MAIGTPTAVGGTPAAHNASDTTTDWSFSSFTPAVGDVLVVSAELIFPTGVFTPTTLSVANTGFTTSGWTQVSTITSEATYDLRTSLFYAVVTASAAGVVTVSRDSSTNAFWLSYGVMYSFTGVDTASPVIQSTSGTSAAGGGATASLTLGSALTTGSALVTNVFDANGGGGETPPTGFTSGTDRLENGDGFYFAYHLSPSSTTVQWSGLEAGLGHGQCVIELRVASSGSTIKRWGGVPFALGGTQGRW